MNQIGDNLYSEVYENGKNSNGQYFFINKEKYNFSIYPVILENLYGNTSMNKVMNLKSILIS